MKSRNLFFNLRNTNTTASAEDFVTEGLCWLAASSTAVGTGLIRLILRAAEATADISEASWFTQVHLSDRESQSRPDMVCECSGIVLVFEHKVDANVISVQIAAHSALAAKRYAPKQIVTVLVTREHHRHRNAANVCLTWLEIQSEPRRFQVLSNAAADSILAQFVEFLGLEGLGRIPGPCPTYWKGNIMEVQKRHQAFPRGYLDLGRKFGSTILPAIVEDWLADTDSDATQDRRFFLEALSAARKSPTPEAAIWRFCRRFFPSYVKYTDHHFGTKLQIPESKGRRFAEGIVASINEDNLIDLLESEQRQDE